jgi:hypothetical protein
LNPASPPDDLARDQAAHDALADDGLGDLTKDELLQEAEARGVEVRTSAPKAEILAAVRAASPAAEEPEE